MHREHGNNSFQTQTLVHFQCLGVSGPVTATGDTFVLHDLASAERKSFK